MAPRLTDKTPETAIFKFDIIGQIENSGFTY